MLCVLLILRIPADRSAGPRVVHAVPELAIRHFVAVDDAGHAKYVVAGFGVRDRGFDARPFGILFMACESKTLFGNVLASDDDFHA